MGMKQDATNSYNTKLGRMGVKIDTASMGEDVGDGHVGPAANGTQGTVPNGYADGYKNQREIDNILSMKAAKPRLDRGRPSFKKGGRVKGTTVNVIVAPQGGGAQPPAPPMPPPMPMPPPDAAAAPGMPPGAGGPPPMMRKRGGRVPMDDGAGSGPGRLEKIAIYGKRAKPGGKAGTM